jgi:hypothetical protein
MSPRTAVPHGSPQSGMNRAARTIYLGAWCPASG